MMGTRIEPELGAALSEEEPSMIVAQLGGKGFPDKKAQRMLEGVADE
jgi:hypothetical protein